LKKKRRKLSNPQCNSKTSCINRQRATDREVAKSKKMIIKYSSTVIKEKHLRK
jgi:hypothetical protein